MRKSLIILITIIGLIFTSCEEKINEVKFTKAETEQVYVFPTDQEYLYKYTQGYYHDVIKGDNLNNLAKRYLKDRERWGDLLKQNDYLSLQADYRHKPHPTLKVWKIFPGERIFLPNDAIGAKSLGVNNSIKFLIGDATHEEFIRDIPTERNMDKIYTGDAQDASKESKTVSDTTRNNNTDWSWLSGFWNFLGPILGMILLVALSILIIWLLFQLFRYLFSLDFGNHNKGNCCHEIRNDITNLGNKMDEQHSQQMQSINSKLHQEYSPAELIRAANEGNINQGYRHIKINDAQRGLKISYTDQRGPGTYHYKSILKKVLEERGACGPSLDEIVNHLAKKLDTIEKREEFINRLSQIENNQVIQFVKDELK